MLSGVLRNNKGKSEAVYRKNQEMFQGDFTDFSQESWGIFQIDFQRYIWGVSG